MSDSLGEAEQIKLTLLFECYRQMMKRRALKILKNEADAEDAIQECFIRLWRRLDLFTEPIKSKSNRNLLLTIITNCSIDIQRKNLSMLLKKKRSEQLHASFDDSYFAGDIETSEFATKSITYIQKKNPMAARVLMLHAVYGFSHKDIADLLGISVTWSQQLMTKARSIARNSKELKKSLLVTLLILLLALLVACAVWIVKVLKTDNGENMEYQIMFDGTTYIKGISVDYVVDGFEFYKEKSFADNSEFDSYIFLEFYNKSNNTRYSIECNLTKNSNENTKGSEFFNSEGAIESIETMIKGYECELFRFDNHLENKGILFLDNGTVKVIGNIEVEDIMQIFDVIYFIE